jgi:hypothetical protein
MLQDIYQYISITNFTWVFIMLRYILLLIICNISMPIFADGPRLLIKIPSRSRPAQFFKVLDLYYANLSGTIPYIFLITCDIDDTSMNNQKVKKRFEQYKNLIVHFGNNRSKVEAYNHDMDLVADWQIVLVTSDDMIPVEKNYDQIICDFMKKYFPDFDGVLNFYDGHGATRTNTLPIIGKKFYDRFGYIYSPTYKSLYCDEELTLISRMLSKEALLHKTIIEHRHPHHGNVAWDDLYKKNEALDKRDQAVFNKRRAHNFYIKRR